MGDGLTASLRIGVITHTRGPWPALLERSRRVEELGFASLHVAEHIVYPRLIAYECWTVLGALAQATSRVTLGTLVAPVTLRQPVLLAEHASAADRISGGRFELGLGAGGAAGDEIALGLRPAAPGEKVARLEATLALCDRLLRGETVELAVDGATASVSVPAPQQRPRPPFAVGAHGPRAIAVAARWADVWVNQGGRDPGTTATTLAEAVALVAGEQRILDEACARIGRDPRTLRRRVLAYRAGADIFPSLGAYDEYAGRFREIGMDELVLYWPEGPDGARDAPAERVLEQIAATRLR